MGRVWTDEQKAKQSALIQAWKPWNRSTGPRTDAGKATASQNRQKALDRADAELKAAKERIRRLHGGRDPHDVWSLLADILKR